MEGSGRTTTTTTLSLSNDPSSTSTANDDRIGTNFHQEHHHHDLLDKFVSEMNRPLANDDLGNKNIKKDRNVTQKLSSKMIKSDVDVDAEAFGIDSPPQINQNINNDNNININIDINAINNDNDDHHNDIMIMIDNDDDDHNILSNQSVKSISEKNEIDDLSLNGENPQQVLCKTSAWNTNNNKINKNHKISSSSSSSSFNNAQRSSPWLAAKSSCLMASSSRSSMDGTLMRRTRNSKDHHHHHKNDPNNKNDNNNYNNSRSSKRQINKLDRASNYIGLARSLSVPGNINNSTGRVNNMLLSSSSGEQDTATISNASLNANRSNELLDKIYRDACVSDPVYLKFTNDLIIMDENNKQNNDDIDDDIDNKMRSVRNHKNNQKSLKQQHNKHDDDVNDIVDCENFAKNKLQTMVMNDLNDKKSPVMDDFDILCSNKVSLTASNTGTCLVSQNEPNIARTTSVTSSSSSMTNLEPSFKINEDMQNDRFCGNLRQIYSNDNDNSTVSPLTSNCISGSSSASISNPVSTIKSDFKISECMIENPKVKPKRITESDIVQSLLIDQTSDEVLTTKSQHSLEDEIDEINKSHMKGLGFSSHDFSGCETHPYFALLKDLYLSISYFENPQMQVDLLYNLPGDVNMLLFNFCISSQLPYPYRSNDKLKDQKLYQAISEAHGELMIKINSRLQRNQITNPMMRVQSTTDLNNQFTRTFQSGQHQQLPQQSHLNAINFHADNLPYGHQNHPHNNNNNNNNLVTTSHMNMPLTNHSYHRNYTPNTQTNTTNNNPNTTTNNNNNNNNLTSFSNNINKHHIGQIPASSVIGSSNDNGCLSSQIGMRDVPNRSNMYYGMNGVNNFCLNQNLTGSNSIGNSPIQQIYSPIPSNNVNNIQQRSPNILTHNHYISPNGSPMTGLYSPNYQNSYGSNLFSRFSHNTFNKRSSFPKEASELLLGWLSKNRNNPYPNDSEKEDLRKTTGLTMVQINNWFTNARRRVLKRWNETSGRSKYSLAPLKSAKKLDTTHLVDKFINDK